MPPKPDPSPARTGELLALLSELKAGGGKSARTTPTFPIGAYVPEDWDQLLTGMTSFSFVDCRKTTGKTPTVLGASLREICFYKVGGERDRYVSFLFATDGKVAYVDPYES